VAILAQGLKCEAHINQNYDVDGLRKSLPERLESLIAAKGDRMSGQQSRYAYAVADVLRLSFCISGVQS
jgi:hypothetical protein